MARSPDRAGAQQDTAKMIPEFSQQEQAFREELVAFLGCHLPRDWRGVEFDEDWDTPDLWEFALAMRRKMAERGFLTIGWPQEYGGGGATLVEQAIFQEETVYYGTPGINVSAINMLGPVLMEFGSSEQKRKHLPAISRGEVTWCQGFSEPGAGSDLASLQTTAIRSGDHYVLNGHKIWTSGAHVAEWCFLLARSDPAAERHRGLSFFLVDMKSPGITCRPLINLIGAHSFNEVFFDDVKVPLGNRVGEENEGWKIATSLLNFERSAIRYQAWARRSLDMLLSFVVEAEGGSLPKDPLVRHRLSDSAIEVEVARLLAYRVPRLQMRGVDVTYHASVSKVFGAEVLCRVADRGMQILGLYSQLTQDSAWSKLQGWFERRYRSSLARKVGGGTSEIQKNVIAVRGLGLPR